MNPEARKIAFTLAFTNSRSPLQYEMHTDDELVPAIQAHAPSASREECREALESVRSLCDRVYEICDAFRSGRYGSGIPSQAEAIRVLSEQNPGFSEAEYRAAFAAGLLWTAT